MFKTRVATVITALMGGATLVLAPPLVAPASASGYCGASEYVEAIEVEPWPDGKFKIMLFPTDESRYDVNPGQVTNSMWSAIQDCVPGVYDTLADSIYDQLQCHQYLGLASFATGATYDLESWRPTFLGNQWVSTQCGNALGVDPPEGPTGPPYTPGALPDGALDLYYGDLA